MMMTRDVRQIPSRIEREADGRLHIVVDDLHHYYPGPDLDTAYLEGVMEDAGYHYRQVLQILRALEKAHADLLKSESKKR